MKHTTKLILADLARIFGVAGTVLALMLAHAPGAKADEAGYFAYLEANGHAPDGYTPPAMYLRYGEAICANLRHGAADPFAGASGRDRAVMGTVTLDAAQRELCPDTLGR